MKKLQDCIREQIDIDNASLDRIASRFRPGRLQKDAFFVRRESFCRELAFIASGYLRLFDLADGREITIWIAQEGSFITSLSSFFFETASLWSIQALADCELQVISREAHFALSRSEPNWLEFDNLLLARSFALLEQRMFQHLHTTARQRFDRLE